jgi:hypothetical protein
VLFQSHAKVDLKCLRKAYQHIAQTQYSIRAIASVSVNATAKIGNASSHISTPADAILEIRQPIGDLSYGSVSPSLGILILSENHFVEHVKSRNDVVFKKMQKKARS